MQAIHEIIGKSVLGTEPPDAMFFQAGEAVSRHAKPDGALLVLRDRAHVSQRLPLAFLEPGLLPRPITQQSRGSPYPHTAFPGSQQRGHRHVDVVHSRRVFKVFALLYKEASAPRARPDAAF